MAVNSAHRIRRRPRPSPIDVFASPEATPMEKGLTVAPITPTCAPRMIMAEVTIRS